MKLAAHTMGTPEYTVPEAIQLFSSIGLDGIEIVVETNGYRSAIPLSADNDDLIEVKKLVQEASLQTACLTPYLNLFNALDEDTRKKECQGLNRVIEMAAILHAPSIRVYGGKLVTGESDEGGRKLEQLVTSMRACGDYAKKYGVKLCLENHFGTMTTTAAVTAGIVQLIDHPNVGILYDQANLAFFPAEEYKEAIRLQKGKIYHVHVKDLEYRKGSGELTCEEVSHIKEEDRTVFSRIPGEGILCWADIVTELKQNGYDGWLSLEYERRWGRQDLPEASVGIPKAARYIRDCMNRC